MQDSLKQSVSRLIKGEVSYTASLLGLNLVISRLQKHYAANPTPATLSTCLQDFQSFLDKYEKVLGTDLSNLAKL